jgi:PAS domain S-box-containing protein
MPDSPSPSTLSLPDLLRRVVDYTDDAILITEAEPVSEEGPRILYVNAAFTRMTGYALEDVVGQTPRILQGPKTSRQDCDEIRVALEAWRPIRKELLNYRKDGSEFWVELGITPVADETGWFRYWVSVQRDTSDRRHFDDQRRLYELILANIDQGILVADALRPDWPIEYVNAGFTRITGYSEEEALGRNCRFLQGPDADPAARAKLKRAIECQESAAVEILNHRKDGSPFWVLISISPLRDARGEVIKYVAVQRDLTETRQREHEMAAAQRLMAVGEMTGGIAHDFNNLLTSISGSAELLAQRVAGDPELASLVGAIRGAAERGGSQVRRLLGFSRTPLLARGPVDLRSVLQQLELLLAQSLRDDITLEIDQDPAARWVDAEAVQLEAALLNLVLNAQDAIARTGRIRLSALSRLEAGQPVVRLEVADTGSGMDEATLARIFEPFYTTKDAGRGSGLGLAMVKAFVTQLGGRIEVSSTPGQGSCFVMTLSSASPPLAVPVSEASPAREAGRPCRVLMVEDDDVVRLTARLMLESLGHSVRECCNADEALEVLDTGEAFDLLFTDLLMPGSMDGLELAKTARRLRPQIGIIMASGWADSRLPTDPSRPPASQFLLKPYSLNDLAGAMATALSG